MEALSKALEDLGFKNEWNNFSYPHGEYFNSDQTQKVCLKGDGIYAYSVGTYANEDYLEMHLNFIPEDVNLLKTLLKRVFYLP